MAKLTVYTLPSIRASYLKSYLSEKGIDYEEISVHDNPEAIAFLESKGRHDFQLTPLPQFYIGDTLVWENGWDDIFSLTAEQINEQVEKINASNKQV